MNTRNLALKRKIEQYNEGTAKNGDIYLKDMMLQIGCPDQKIKITPSRKGGYLVHINRVKK